MVMRGRILISPVTTVEVMLKGTVDVAVSDAIVS